MPRTLEQILASTHVERQELDALFARFDTDGSGQLERAELQNLAQRLSQHLPNTPVEDMMEIFDFYEVDRDGKISPDEFAGFFAIHLDK